MRSTSAIPAPSTAPNINAKANLLGGDSFSADAALRNPSQQMHASLIKKSYSERLKSSLQCTEAALLYLPCQY